MDERYRLNHAIGVKLFHPYTQVPRSSVIGKSPFLAHRDFLIIAPYKYSSLLAYLLRGFLLIISMAVLLITRTN